MHKLKQESSNFDQNTVSLADFVAPMSAKPQNMSSYDGGISLLNPTSKLTTEVDIATAAERNEQSKKIDLLGLAAIAETSMGSSQPVEDIWNAFSQSSGQDKEILIGKVADKQQNVLSSTETIETERKSEQLQGLGEKEGRHAFNQVG